MKKTLSIAALAATMMTATVPAKAQDLRQMLGPILGGVAGGFVGNQFGKGKGNAVATAVGAFGGVLLGQSSQQPVAQCGSYNSPCHQVQVVGSTTSGNSSCDQYVNIGARASCNRGVADRNRAYQQKVERQAYNFGRGN
jgi:outer membrane lipoprotein SlyB